jgi:Fuc2NAc and GlcNAc transferase
LNIAQGTVFAWIAAAAISTIVVALVRWWTTHKGYLAAPNERDSHTKPTARGGGLGIVIAVAVVTRSPFVILMAAALLVAAVSLVDDIRSLSARVRLCVHVAAAAIVVVFVGSLPGILGMAVTLVWIVAMTNIYNFMDGIDGIAGVQAVIAGAAWAIIGARSGQESLTLLGGTIAAAALGFLLHNWPPARIFMGDVGSAFLGFTLASLPLLSPRRVELCVPAVLILWPFVFDGTFTILRRLRNRENIFAAHRSHVYQRLVIAGRSHAFVTTLYAALAMLGAMAAIALAR